MGKAGKTDKTWLKPLKWNLRLERPPYICGSDRSSREPVENFSFFSARPSRVSRRRRCGNRRCFVVVTIVRALPSRVGQQNKLTLEVN